MSIFKLTTFLHLLMSSFFNQYFLPNFKFLIFIINDAITYIFKNPTFYSFGRKFTDLVKFDLIERKNALKLESMPSILNIQCMQDMFYYKKKLKYS